MPDDVQLSTLGATIKTALIEHDGTGSLLDADMVDGQHAQSVNSVSTLSHAGSRI